MYAAFNHFGIKMTLSQAKLAYHQGQCDEDVAALVATPAIVKQLRDIGPVRIMLELREFGAWDDEELMDWEANKGRIVWIAAGNIVDEHG